MRSGGTRTGFVCRHSFCNMAVLLSSMTLKRIVWMKSDRVRDESLSCRQQLKDADFLSPSEVKTPQEVFRCARCPNEPEEYSRATVPAALCFVSRLIIRTRSKSNCQSVSRPTNRGAYYLIRFLLLHLISNTHLLFKDSLQQIREIVPKISEEIRVQSKTWDIELMHIILIIIFRSI